MSQGQAQDQLIPKYREETRSLEMQEMSPEATIALSMTSHMGENQVLNPENLPSVFLLPEMGELLGEFETERDRIAYERMKAIKQDMESVAQSYLSAKRRDDRFFMQTAYIRAQALQQEFFRPINDEKPVLVQKPGFPTPQVEEKPSRLKRKAQVKRAKKIAQDAKKENEKFYSQTQDAKSFKALSTVTPKEPIQENLMQSLYVREVVLRQRTEYKNEQGEKGEVTQAVLLERAMKGDYSRLESLDPGLRNMLAAKFMRSQFAQLTQDPARDADYIEKNLGLSQPLLRIGISLGMRGLLRGCRLTPDYFKQLDAALNKAIMVNTLTVNAGTVAKQKANFSAEEIERNKQSQLFIARTMLLCHIGSFKQKDHKKVSGDWQGPVSNAFAHCSRVGIILPGLKKSLYTKDSERSTVDSYTGAGGGLQEGFFKRGGATHRLQRKGKGKHKSFKEIKLFSAFHQQGMNVAVGGLGGNGITGPDGQARMLKNDGSCGHIFMHLKEGDADNYTSMLVGFESDSYKMTNQLGHTHGFGNGEFASSFGGQRVDEIGDKYGGREVDLTSFDPSAFALFMTFFSANYAHLQGAAETDPEAATKLRRINESLCGARMTEEQMTQFVRDLSLERQYQDLRGSQAH